MTVIEVKRAPGRRMGWCAHLAYVHDSRDEDFDGRVTIDGRSAIRVSSDTPENTAHAARSTWGDYPVLFCTRRRP